MNKLFTGLAGSGKTIKLINKAYSLIEKHNLTHSEILILTLTPQEKDALKEINNKRQEHLPLNIQFFETFCSSILSKSLKYIDFKTISDDQSIVLINSIAREEFAQNSNMLSLTKSNSFARELYNLFGILKSNDITDKSFVKILNSSKINDTDQTRLYLVAKVYAKYNKTLYENKLIDYRDSTKVTINILKDNENLLNYIKSMYKYILVDGFQNISVLQLELLKLISEDNLLLFGDELARIQDYKGAWQNSLEVDCIKQYINTVEHTLLEDNSRNNDILNRALYLIEDFSNNTQYISLDKSDSIAYIDFEDLDEEIAFIAAEIKKLMKEKNYSYSDIAIIVRDYELRHKFIEHFKAYGIPVNSELFNDYFANLKSNIIRYFSLCNAFELINMYKFNSYELEKAALASVVDTQNLHQEINLYFENILNTLFTNNFYKHKLLSIFENSNYRSLIYCSNRHQEILPELERAKFEAEIKKIYRIYNLYKERKLLEAISIIMKSNTNLIFNDNYAEFTGALLSKIASMLDLHKYIIKEKISYKTIIDTINSSTEEIKVVMPAIHLESAFRVIGREYKCIFIPALTEITFPKKYKATHFISPEANDIFSATLRKEFSNFKSIIESDEDALNSEIKLFYLAMTRAKDKLYLSTHNYEDKKQVQPSIFYSFLKENDINNVINIADIDINEDITDYIPLKKSLIVNVSNEKLVIQENEELRLSASSISQYLKCPRQYFYRNLIELKEDITLEASYGLIVHSILEVFNKNYSSDYTKENLLKLIDVYFDSLDNPEKAIEKGFKHRDIEMLKITGILNINVMKDSFIEAVKLMEENFYFEKPFEEIETEKSFEYTIYGIENVKFKSRIDAIFKTKDGYNIVDYKTGKNQDKLLNYYISEYGVKFQGDSRQYKGKFSENNVKKYKYQIPLYYTALQQDEKYKDKLNKLGLTYIRPKAKDNGFKDDYVSASQIKYYKDQIINNILKTVVQPIRETKTFEADTSSDFGCNYCSYKLLCDAKEEDDE